MNPTPSAAPLVTRLNLSLLVLFAAVTMAAFLLVPADAVVAIHWGPDGRPDRFAGRTLAFLLLPGIAVAVGTLIVGITRLAPRAGIEAGRHVLGVVVPALLALFVVIQGTMMLIALGHPLPVPRIIAVCMGLFQIALGNVIPKTRINHYAGIRLPWTLEDPVVWQKTHRLLGALMILAGLALLLAALVISEPLVLFVVVLTALFAPIILATLYARAISGRADG